MRKVVNIAGYKFVPLAGLPALRGHLSGRCKELGLKGTILLSPEGINLFVAGGRREIDALEAELRSIDGLADFELKVSVSAEQPFRRMLVKIKQEIIAFGVAGIEPGRATSAKIAPRELKQWLDEGRPVTLLDTRNDYEVQLGTFENALALGIDHFRHFPAAVRELPGELKQQPIVMFCTGGIRCEKAGPLMEREGFEHVYQLEGGILKYFEECGGEHYRGECFVFDRRVGVDAELAETENGLCFHCLEPLTADDLRDPRYVEGESCPRCYRTPAERMARAIAEREAAIRRVTTPLPASVPYENVRPLNVAAAHDGRTLLETVCAVFPHLEADHWLGRFAAGMIVDRDRRPADTERRVRAGEQYLHRLPATREPDVNAAIRVLYEDEAIVVVEKPAPLPVHASGRYNRNTLQWILNAVYAPQKLRPVHRLDANTTGVVLLARTRQFAGPLVEQFAAGTVEKVYLARIVGTPPEDVFECNAPIGNEQTSLGGREIDENGLAARTEFRVLRRHYDGTTLLEARPTTGRTNQIRLHLAHLGWPICGDQAYVGAGQIGETQTHAVGDPPLCLHARRIAFAHPLSGECVTFESELPEWASTNEPSN
ncbi:MAG: RluA family pseudouridine synthase [Pirellulales bacterium]